MRIANKFHTALSYFSFPKVVAFVALLAIFSSCSDNGCIEADDFGEYQTQTLEVKASSSFQSCEFDNSDRLNLHSETHGTGLGSCFTSRNITIYDSNGQSHNSMGEGCSRWQPLLESGDTNPNSNTEVLGFCVSECIAQCNAELSGSFSNPNPVWMSSDKRALNGEVTLAPGTEISVRASGNVTLGGLDDFADIYLFPNISSFMPNQKTVNNDETYISVSSGDVMQIKLEGGYSHSSGPGATEDIGLRNSLRRGSISGAGHGDRVDYAFRRIVMHLESPPYGFSNSSGNFRKSDFDGTVPFSPDYSLYSCDYTSVHPSCSRGASCPPQCVPDHTDIRSAAEYPSLTGTNEEVVERYQAAFPIFARIGENGGMVLPNDAMIDRFKPKNFEPSQFSITNCSRLHTCSGVVSTGEIVGDLSTSSSIIHDIIRSSQILFKFLDSQCAVGGAIINVKVKDSNGPTATELYNYDIEVTDSWGSGIGPNERHISVEGGQFIEISRVSGPASFTDNQGTAGIDCGRSLAMKYLEYRNLTIQKSGLVSFANIPQDATASGSCNIKFRIINPTGSHVDIPIDPTIRTRYGIGSSVPTINADFYEYGDFNASSAEEDLRLPGSVSGPGSVSTTFSSSLDNKIYVRSGQIVRFAPESWDGTWSPEASVVRRCGIGMAIKIEPRPAYLCKGQGSVYVRNPDCIQIVEGDGEIRGCESSSNLCNDQNSNMFCAGATDQSSPCIGTISFTEPTDSLTPRSNPQHVYPNFVDSISSPDAPECMAVYDVAAYTDHDSNPSTPDRPSRYDKNATKVAKCRRCQENALAAAATQPPMIQRSNVPLCYDLEGYTGKVSNLSIGATFNIYNLVNHPSNNDSDPIHAVITKGARVLPRFNSTTGSLSNFGDEAEDYMVSGASDYFFGANARLSLIYLDGDSFTRSNIKSSYLNGISSGPVTYDSSNKNNGFKLSFFDYMNFSNGENMEVLFCIEGVGGNNNHCRGSNYPSRVDNVDDIISFTSPGNATNKFAFDTFGNLYRTGRSEAGKFMCDGAAEGDRYLCHCRGSGSGSQTTSVSLATTTSVNTGDSSNACSTMSGDDDSSPCNSVDDCKYRLTFKIVDPEVPDCFMPLSVDDASTTGDETESLPCGGVGQLSCTGVKVRNLSFVANGTLIDEDINPTPAGCGGRGNPPCTSSTTKVLAAGNDGNICSYGDTLTSSTSSTVDPSLCKKEFVCSSKYSNNTGQYDVLVRVKNKNLEVSGLVESIINPVLEALDGSGTPGSSNYQMGQVERVYTAIINDSYYKLVLKMSLILMITFYGLSYLMGLTEGGTSEIITKVLKIALVLFFVSDQGWYWFNTLIVTTFKDGTNQISFMMATSFDNSPLLREALASGDYSNKSILFSSIDKVLGLFFTSAVQKKISALLFSGLFGWLYILIIYYAFIAYIFAVATSVLIYLTAQVFISILFILGPIFFIFTLFNQTKEMFDKWLQNLIGFSLQQIFLLLTLSFFNMMMYEIIRNALGYRVCWDEVWTINIIIRISLLSFWTIPNVPPLFDSNAEIGNSGRGEGIPNLFSILFIWIVAELMKQFVEFMSNVAADIGGGIKATELSSGVSRSVQGMRKSIGNMKYVREAKNWVSRNTTQALDRKLFDSGKLAKRDRENKKHQDKMDMKNKKAMIKEGKEAVHKFKKDAGAELAKMTKSEQREKMNKIRDDAMSDKGKSLGLRDSEIERLKTERGTKYRGDNLAGYLAARTNQRFLKKGGAVSKSITEKDVNADFSKKEARKALTRADKEGRDDLIKAIEKGDVYVKSGSVRKRMTPKFNPRITESSEYKEARKQLEREGKIKTIGGDSLFGSVVRSATLKDEEKKMIRERTREIKARNEDSKISKTARASTVASLQRSAEIADAVESGDASNKYVRKKMIGDGLTGRYTLSKSKDKIAEVKKNRLSSIAEQLKAKSDRVNAEIGEYEKQESDINQEVDALDAANQDKSQIANEYKERFMVGDKHIPDRKLSSQERQDKARLTKLMSKTSFQKYTSQRDALLDKKISVVNKRDEAIERQTPIAREMENVKKLNEIQGNAQAIKDDESLSKNEKKDAKAALTSINKLSKRVMGRDSGIKAAKVGTTLATAGLARLGDKRMYSKSTSTRIEDLTEKYSYLTNKEQIEANDGAADDSTQRIDPAPLDNAPDDAGNVDGGGIDAGGGGGGDTGGDGGGSPTVARGGGRTAGSALTRQALASNRKAAPVARNRGGNDGVNPGNSNVNGSNDAASNADPDQLRRITRNTPADSSIGAGDGNGRRHLDRRGSDGSDGHDNEDGHGHTDADGAGTLGDEYDDGNDSGNESEV